MEHRSTDSLSNRHVNIFRFIIKFEDIFFSLIISIGFIDWIIEKTYNCFILTLTYVFFSLIIILLIYAITYRYFNIHANICHKTSEVMFCVSVAIATWLYQINNYSFHGLVAIVLFLLAGFILFYKENASCITKDDEYDISEYWIKVFGKSYDEVIYEHYKCINNGTQSRLSNAYSYIVNDKNLHTEIYTKRITYIWIIESLFISGEVYFYINISSNNFYIYLMLIIAILGLYSTYLWVQTLNGAKYCEENAEKHLSMLEEHIMGNISKVLWIDKYKKQPISVSNYRICQMFFCVWSLILFIVLYDLYNCISYVAAVLLIIVNIMLYFKLMRRIPISKIKRFKYIP